MSFTEEDIKKSCLETVSTCDTTSNKSMLAGRFHATAAKECEIEKDSLTLCEQGRSSEFL